jgi:aminoglycoside N3'-acetyltransferase
MKAVIQIIKSIMRSRFPYIFKVLSKNYFDIKRVKARIVWRLTKKEISEDVLANQLRRTGLINAGDILIVHSSLSAIGKVIGGPEAVCRALQKVVTKSGTLLMPSYHQHVPVIKMIKDGTLIDLRVAESSVGMLTETFRTLPCVIRSSHPFSSVCAWGRDAAEIAGGHSDTPLMCGPGSPFYKLLERSGKYMGIGVDIRIIALYHVLEDNWSEFPVKVHYTEKFVSRYVDTSGQFIQRELIILNPDVSRNRIDQEIEGAWIRDFLTDHMKKQGIIQEFMLGQANSWIVDARTFYEELKSLAKQGITIYTTKKEFNKMKVNLNENRCK